MDLLRSQNKKVLFITNSPIFTREDCVKRLNKLGIATALEEVITATFISVHYFLNYAPDALVYLIGENALETEFNRSSLKMTKNPMEATHVLVGLDRSFTYEKLHWQRMQFVMEPSSF